MVDRQAKMAVKRIKEYIATQTLPCEDSCSNCYGLFSEYLLAVRKRAVKYDTKVVKAITDEEWRLELIKEYLKAKV